MKKPLSQKQITFLSAFTAFLIPLVVMCAVYAFRGIAPFGNTSILVWDSKLQYKDYFGYLWDVLHGNASFEYSVSKSLGGQTIGLVAYYLTCPLNLLIYFIKKSQIALFISIETLLKISFSGLTAAYFVRKRYEISAFWSVLVSVCYALMEYNVAYCANLMWLDGVVILPLACLGVYELLYNNKKALLYSMVAIAIISNWYAGFMVCLMTGFYFLFELVLKYDFRQKGMLGKNIKFAFLDAVKVGADMVLGVLTSGALLIPALLSLVGGKAKLDLLRKTINVGPLASFKGFAINANSNYGDAPIMFCGSVLLVLAVYFLFNKKEDIKLRVCSAVYFLFMLFSFVLDELNLMWTAFVQSNSYAFRWAFTFGFLMLMLGAMGARSIKEKGLDKLSVLKASVTVFAIFLYLLLAGKFYGRLGACMTFCFIVLFASLVFVVALTEKQKLRKALCVLVAVITVGELGYNAYDTFDKFKDNESDYVSFVEEMEPVIAEIKAKDSGFFRLEKHASYLNLVNRNVANSESFLFNYSGVENYTSTYDANVDEFFAGMGYSDSTYIPDEESEDEVVFPTDIYWNDPQLVMDSVLGIKYQILEKQAPGLNLSSINAAIPMDMALYENPYALPLAFNASGFSENAPLYGRNPFENQESFVSAILGRDAGVYKIIASDFDGIKEGRETYYAVAEIDGPMYFYTDGRDVHTDLKVKNCGLFVNNDYVCKICTRFESNVIYLGDFKKGEKVKIHIKYYTEPLSEHNVYLAQLDMPAFEQAISEIKAKSSTDLNISGNKVSGTYTTDADSTVMITLPYTEGWSVYVDNQLVDYRQLGEIFIGIDIPAGTHEIKMVYKTLHRNAGLAASAFGIFGFCAWRSAEYVIKKKKNTE